MRRGQRGEDQTGPVDGERGEGPRGGESAAAARGGGGPQRVTPDDALTYLKGVKARVQEDGEKWNEFLEVMKDLVTHKVDTTGVIVRVTELLQGHPDLIEGFKAFLPASKVYLVGDV